MKVNKRIIRTLVGHQLQINSYKPDIIKEMENMERTTFYRILKVISIFILFILLCYQTYDRIKFYLSEPTVADVYIAEMKTKDFPSFLISPSFTTETIEHINAEAEKNCEKTSYKTTSEIRLRNECYDSYSLLNYSGSVIRFRFNRIPSYLDDFYLAIGNNRKARITHRASEGIMTSGTSFFPEIKLNIGGPEFKMIFKFKKDIHHREIEIFVQNQEERVFLGTNILLMATIFPKLIKIETLINDYKFVSTKSRPCEKSLESRNKCLVNCWIKQVTNLTCRFPVPFADDLQPCPNNDNVDYVARILRVSVLMTEEMLSQCELCIKACRFTTYVNRIYFIQSDQTEIQFHVPDNILRFIEERLFYSIISLICELGGNLGLLFGVSCLSLVHIIVYYYQVYRKNLHSPPRFAEIRRKISFELIKQQRKNISQKKSIPKLIFSSNFIFYYLPLLCLTMLSCYYIYERIQNYLSYPIAITIFVKNDEIYNFPQFLICRDNQLIIDLKLEIARAKNISYKDIDFLDLLDSPSPVAGNATKLWDLTYNGEAVHLPSRQTLFGNCEYYPRTSTQYTKSRNFFLSDQQFHAATTKLIIESAANILHPHHLLLIPSYWSVEITLLRKTIIRQNSPIRPCSNVETFEKCEDNCYKKLLRKEKISCRLPFMKQSNLSECQNSTSAKDVQKIHLNVYKRDPKIECSCQFKCVENIYLPFFNTKINLITQFNSYITLKMEYANNIHEIFEEQLLNTFIKLLCDIGSIISILIGTSLFSLLQILHQ